MQTVDISNNGGTISGKITIESGATITSTRRGSNTAIANASNATLTGGITISVANTKLEGNIVKATSL